MGRPSKYKPEYVEQAAKLVRLHAGDREIADFLGVNEATIHRWKLAHPEFCESLTRTKEEVDAQVEQSLWRRANGYSHKSEKVFQFQGQIVRAETVEHYPPDPTSMIFWLKNRQPDKWRDKRPEDTDNSNTVVVIHGGIPDDRTGD